MKRKILALLLINVFAFSAITGCSGDTAQNEAKEEAQAIVSGAKDAILSIDPSLSAEEIVSGLTLEQKASQMVQGDIKQMSLNEMERNGYGSVLSITDEIPPMTDEQWLDTVRQFQLSALASDSGIPYIYGQDSVHGLYGVYDAIIYPHNINVGAANDPDLTYEYGKLVASDMKHAGTILNFGPCVAAAQDPRWGRTYESFSSELDRVSKLSTSFVSGQLDEGVVVCPKHFFADGNAIFGTGELSDGTERLIDRGDAVLTDAEIDELLDVYKTLIDEGVQAIMITHSSVNGVKMHENKEYIMKLKDDFGFKGFILSDWDSIHNCSGETLYDNVVLAVNAGIDMLMEDSAYETCRDHIVEAVNNGDISEERVNDAAERIIRVKKEAGLFDDPMLKDSNPSFEFASDEGKAVARKLVAESFVLFKDGDYSIIPSGSRVFVTGPAADDSGVLCGGWTNNWQGSVDWSPTGRWVENATTILDGLREAADDYGIEVVTDPSEISSCDMVLLCIGEIPYAEWLGDTSDLSVTGALGLEGNQEAIELAKESGLPTVTLVVSGRNVILDDNLNDWDSVILMYLPGTEGGHAIADVLTGKEEYKGTLPMPYYSSTDKIESGKYTYPAGYSDQ